MKRGDKGGPEIMNAQILCSTCVIYLHNTAEAFQTSPYDLARLPSNAEKLKIIWGNRGEVRSLRILEKTFSPRLAGTCHPPATPLFRRTTFYSGGLQAADLENAWLQAMFEAHARSLTRKHQRDLMEAWYWRISGW